MEKGSRHGALLWAGRQWGVELLIPLLKHTKYYYFCELSMCRPMPTWGKWLLAIELISKNEVLSVEVMLPDSRNLSYLQENNEVHS